MNKKVLLVAILAAVAVAGCSKKSRRGDTGDDSSGSSSSSSGGPSGGVTGDVYGGSSGAGGQGGAGADGAMPGDRLFFFEFDSSELNPQGQMLVDAWGAYLSANPGVKVRLEGHADERGTREYNVALGERRANTVLQALTSRGVSAQQLTVSSFGEERPVALGHDDASWSQNRRVEVVQ